VLTTIIAMVFGFNVVLALSVVVYLVALAALRRLQRPFDPAIAGDDGAGDEAAVSPPEPGAEGESADAGDADGDSTDEESDTEPAGLR